MFKLPYTDHPLTTDTTVKHFFKHNEEFSTLTNLICVTRSRFENWRQISANDLDTMLIYHV